MTALLTNPTGIEMQFKFRWQGKNRYINELFVPNTNVATWDFEAVMDQVLNESGWVSALADCMNDACILESITGNIRGRDDSGTTLTLTIEQAGLVVGTATPSWLTYNVWQIPDNTNRLIVSGSPTLFKRGRLAFPGVTAEAITGNTLTQAVRDDYMTAATAMLAIPAGADPNVAPAFSAIITRHLKVGTQKPYTYVLQAKANFTGVVAGRVGTQLTAR